MKIEHLAIWTHDLEKVKDFYVRYFNMKCGEKYKNPLKNFSSYFLSFEGRSTRIELMHRPDIATLLKKNAASLGLTHFAISVGSKKMVDQLTNQLHADGYKIIGEPRTTGDGYYESVVEDCEGNWVEIIASNMDIKNIVFDFGGVLIDWNPEYLYRDLFQEQELSFFLNKVCNAEWNLKQDEGRSFLKGIVELSDKFPQYSDKIKIYHTHWIKMIGGEIKQNTSLIKELKANYRLFGLTNWSSETFPLVYDKYAFFKDLEGIVVSGTERVVKPNRTIYNLLLSRYDLKPEQSLFIDDNDQNIRTAEEIGFKVLHYTNASNLRQDLAELGIKMTCKAC